MGCVVSNSHAANAAVATPVTASGKGRPLQTARRCSGYPCSPTASQRHAGGSVNNTSNSSTNSQHRLNPLVSKANGPGKLEGNSGSDGRASIGTAGTEPNPIPTPVPDSSMNASLAALSATQAVSDPKADLARVSLSASPFSAGIGFTDQRLGPVRNSNYSSSNAPATVATFAARTASSSTSGLNAAITMIAASNSGGNVAHGDGPRLTQHRPQLSQRRRSTTSNSSRLHFTRESMLSDISTTLSTTTSTIAMPSPDCGNTMKTSDLGNTHTGSGNANAHRNNSCPNGLFHNGSDLEAQRQQAPLNIAEDLFVYDDIVISKDEARTKHWRVAGRKPALAVDTSAGNSPSEMGASGASTTGFVTGSRRRSSSLSGKNLFSFNDFDVCVDELDWLPANPAAQAALQHSAQLSATAAPHEATERCSIKRMSTVPTAPNTVAHFLLQERAKASKVRRPLRDFSATPILGHATRVKCIALTPAETEFASCSNEDASIALNSLSVRSDVGIFTGHKDTIINAAFSPDGKYLATTSKDRTMILWDVMTTKILLNFAHPKVVICCCFGPDSKYLVSGCQDRVCRLWDTKRGKEWLTYTAHEGIIIAIAFCPDGNYVCSASADRSLRIWSATTAKTRFHLTGHTGIILSCSYTTDGRHIVSNDESLLKVWSAEDGSCKLSLTPAMVAGSAQPNLRGPKLGWTLSSAAPGAFTNYMLVACNNRFVYVLDMTTGEVVTSTFCKAPVYCLTAGTYEKMACGDSFGNIYVLHLT